MTEFQHPAEQGSEMGDFLNPNTLYPTYQYSVFLNGGREEQLVVRASTFGELLAGKRNINKVLEKVNNHHRTPDVGSQEVCDHPKTKLLTVKKVGPNTGRNFKSCQVCGAFLGFV